MSWVVDTCVLIDILVNDPTFGRSSALCLKRNLSKGLVICPVSMIELSPAFGGDIQRQKKFLQLCGVHCDHSFSDVDIVCAHKVWNHYIAKKRLHDVPRRPVANIMIGAFSSRFDGLITRNQNDFNPWFPKLKLIVPGHSKS